MGFVSVTFNQENVANIIHRLKNNGYILKNIVINDNKTITIDFVYNSNQKKSLSLYNYGIIAINKIEDSELKILELSYNNITKIENLQELISLTCLDLSHNNIEVIENLDLMNNLEKLNLNNNKITKIEGLSELKKLKKLYLLNNKITKIEGLSELKNLEILYLSYNQITQIEGLSELKNLIELYLDRNKITKIEGLSDLKNIQELALSYNQINKIEKLSDLTNLSKLWLQNNKIMKIEGLSDLKKIQTLYLCDNQITRLEGLSELKNLSSLNLIGNNIINKDYDYPFYTDIPLTIEKNIVIENKTVDEIVNDIIKVRIEKKLKKGDRYHFDKYYSVQSRYEFSCDMIRDIIVGVSKKRIELTKLGLDLCFVKFSYSRDFIPDEYIYIDYLIGYE